MKDQRMDLSLITAFALLTFSLPFVESSSGLNTHLKVVALLQPPFAFKRLDGTWTGIEVRFLDILSRSLNFTFEVASASGKVMAPKSSTWASSDHAVVVEVASGNADLGIGGVHLVPGSTESSEVQAIYPHSHDCGVFLTQGSLALPRHRAIMGPFHWKVWLSLTIAYLFGSIPFTLLYSTGERALLPPSSATYSSTKSPSILAQFWQIIRRLHEAFWDVFGTFSNAFTLEKGWRSVGVRLEEAKEESISKRPSSYLSMERRKSSNATSWIGSLNEKAMAAIVGKEGLRLLVAFYWAFTVIVSALYTGSIIAFITLPVFPKPYETGEELRSAGFIWGTLASGDWAQWLRESDGPVGEQVRKLTARAEAYGCGCRGMRLFRTAEKGIRSVEQSSNLAFLSSRSLIKYLISHPASTNEEEDEEDTSLFSLNILKKVVGKRRRRPVLAMSSECFLPFRIGYLVKSGKEGRRISEALKLGLMFAEQAGLLEKERQDADEEVGAGEEEEINLEGKVVSSSEKRWRTTHGQRLIFGGGFRLGHGVLTERILSLDDVQGIFLLLGAGFAMAFFALFMEIIVVRINKRFHRNSRHQDDDTGIESEFSDYQDFRMDDLDEENWQCEESENEVTKENKDDSWVFHPDDINYPRRTSAPAPATDICQREFSKISIKPRRAKSSYMN